MTTIFYHDLNRVLYEFGPLSIKYYGMAYALGVLICLFYVKRLNKKQYIMPEREYDDMLVYIILGILLGGRIGYFLMYKIAEIVNEPFKVLRIWECGMSFHGGLLGVIIALYIFARKNRIPFFRLTDIVSPAVPIGLFLGRIANFINGELWGRATDSDWGIVFPMADEIPRHPSQLYQAFCEGILLFAIINLVFFKTDLSKKRGFFSGLFLVLYGFFRILTENFREPDYFLGFIFDLFTMGQLLSIPMIITGSIILYGVFRLKKNDFIRI